MHYLVIELNKQEQFLTLILEHEKEIEEITRENIGASKKKSGFFHSKRCDDIDSIAE